MIPTSENTFYRPGETLLYKVDPRLKLCACLLVVVVTFAAGNWIQLVLPVLVLGFAGCSLAPLPSALWRICWMLRWLILFTLLMHLLFTDGRPLLGLSWLSLDGLYNGLQVCLQMLMAVVAAAVLSITTPVVELVAAFGWYARPLKWLGCQTDEWQTTLLLALRMLPVVSDEIQSVKASREDQETIHTESPSRWYSMGTFFKLFVDRLLTRGDEAARELATEEIAKQPPVTLPGLWPLTLQDQLFAASCVIFMLVYGLFGI